MNTCIKYRAGKYFVEGLFIATFELDFGEVIYRVCAAANSGEGLKAVKAYIDGDSDTANNYGDNKGEFVAIYTTSYSDEVISVSSTDFSFTESCTHKIDSSFDVRPIKGDLEDQVREQNINFTKFSSFLIGVEHIDSIFR